MFNIGSSGRGLLEILLKVQVTSFEVSLGVEKNSNDFGIGNLVVFFVTEEYSEVAFFLINLLLLHERAYKMKNM